MLTGLIELVYMKITFIFGIALIHLWTKEKERLVLGENNVFYYKRKMSILICIILHVNVLVDLTE